jgi:cell division septal protein FtsQ
MPAMPGSTLTVIECSFEVRVASKKARNLTTKDTKKEKEVLRRKQFKPNVIFATKLCLIKTTVFLLHSSFVLFVVNFLACFRAVAVAGH